MKNEIGKRIVYWYRHNVGDGKSHDKIIDKYVHKINETRVLDMADMNISANSFVSIPIYRDIYRHCSMVQHVLRVTS